MFKEEVQKYRKQQIHGILQELIQFVSIPNNVYRLSDIQRNADYLKRIMRARGIEVQELARPGERPMIFGERITDPGLPTLLFYSHYDGVPVEPDRWHSDPYTPTLRKTSPGHPGHEWTSLSFDSPLEPQWRLYGRSVADSKNAIIAMLAALDILKALSRPPGVNLILKDRVGG